MFNWLWKNISNLILWFFGPILSQIEQAFSFFLTPEISTALFSAITLISDIARIGVGLLGVNPVMLKFVLYWYLTKIFLVILVNPVKLAIRWYDVLKL